MLITISTTYQPATDLGYLLYKHPERAQEFDLSFGRACVFYPEASETRCTAALYLELDPIKLVRGAPESRKSGAEDNYVNDRPYVASSYLSVALREVFGSAIAGNSRDRPELVDKALPLEITLSAVSCPGDGSLIGEIFEPLGYTVKATPIALDPAFPEWGESSYFEVSICGEAVLSTLLSQLYVLIPVLDGKKHYFVQDDEVEKLLRHGENWLPAHPKRELILRRYLKYQRTLVDAASAELLPMPSPPEPEEATRPPLHEQRLTAVVDLLTESTATRVLDLGCGEGKLMQRLAQFSQFQEILGIDVSWRSLQRAALRLGLEGWPNVDDDRLRLKQGSLLYRDQNLEGYDAAVLIEVIEHLDPQRLATLEEVLFEHTRPDMVLITTPNREYNALWERLPAESRRHEDHRFEWTRAEFRQWANRVASRYGYTVTHRGIGPKDKTYGTPTQMGIFQR